MRRSYAASRRSVRSRDERRLRNIAEASRLSRDGRSGRAPRPLFARRFSDLDRCFGSYQESFEKDFRKEHLPEDAQDAFAVADPRLEPLLDEWVKEFPRSFGAWASRGAYRSTRNWRVGGVNAVIASVRDAFAQRRQLARADLARALELRPRAISVFRTLVGDSLDDRTTSRKWLDASLEVCPDCYRVRRAYFTCLRPRWGGSHEEMESFTRDVAEHARSPKLKTFPGLVHWIEAVDEPDPREALVGYQKAMYFGEHWEFVFYRGLCRLRLGEPQEALKDFDRALELRPQTAEILMNRAELLLGSGLPARAAADLLLALRLDPTFYCLPRVFDGVLQPLFAQAQRLLHDGLPEEALVPMRLVHDLDPVGLAGPARPLTDASRRVVEACEDTIEAFVRVGWELGESGDNEVAIALWTRYVTLHPKSADGYRYRAVAHLRKGQLAESEADVARAKALGGKSVVR